jgi:hypothetical protein
MDRKEYQRRYYASKKKQDNEANAIPSQTNRITLQNVFKFLFIVLSSLFITIEISQFYALVDPSPVSPYIKAILGEVTMLVLASLKPKSNLDRVVYSTSLVICIALSGYAFTSVSYKQYNSTSQNRQTSVMNIRSLENQIKIKQSLVEFYRLKDWSTKVGQLDRDLNQLNKQLKVEFNMFKHNKTNNIADLIVVTLFRILIQLTNIFLIKSIVEKPLS